MKNQEILTSEQLLVKYNIQRSRNGGSIKDSLAIEREAKAQLLALPLTGNEAAIRGNLIPAISFAIKQLELL